MTAILSIGRILAAWLVLLPAFLVAPASADFQQPPGSRIQMAPPEGFEVSKLFSGFIHPVAGASIVIAELPPGQFDKIKAGFTDAALAEKGLANVARSQLQRPDQHFYFTATQALREQEYTKFVMMIADSKATAVITVNVPTSSLTDGFVKRDAVAVTLQTAKFTEKAAPIVKPFSLSYLGPFKEAGKLSGPAILYTEDGSLQAATPGQTRNVLIVAPSLDKFVVTELSGFAELAVHNLGGFGEITVVKKSDVQIAGLEGVRIDAKGKAVSDQTDVTIHQVILKRNGGGYFRLVSIARAADATRLTPEIDKVFASFEPVQ